ncbi:hypothetical protein CF319_g7860 [Tilletia indica]|nr:hypothetical protein CF319_g7860 [Tilletia indica]
MNSTLTDRLAFLAGLIESDGSYSLRNNTYEISQAGDEHRKIISDAKQMAESCGITTSMVYKRQVVWTNHQTGESRVVDSYRISLGSGHDRLQPFMSIGRKQANSKVVKMNPDYQVTWRVTTEGSTIGDYVSVECEGHKFQLSDRTLVLDSSKSPLP